VSVVSGGSSARGVAKLFGSGISTAVRWAQRLRTEGHAEARVMGGDHRSRLTGHRGPEGPTVRNRTLSSVFLSEHDDCRGQGLHDNHRTPKRKAIGLKYGRLRHNLIDYNIASRNSKMLPQTKKPTWNASNPENPRHSDPEQSTPTQVALFPR